MKAGPVGIGLFIVMLLLMQYVPFYVTLALVIISCILIIYASLKTPNDFDDYQ